MLKWAVGGLVAAIVLLVLQFGAPAAIIAIASGVWGAVGLWRLGKIRGFLKARGYRPRNARTRPAHRTGCVLAIPKTPLVQGVAGVRPGNPRGCPC